MMVGAALLAGGVLYFTRLLNNYVDYGDAVRAQRADDIERGKKAAKKWERDPRSAPGDRALRHLSETLESTTATTESEQPDPEFVAP
jgi:hypothetical protein